MIKKHKLLFIFVPVIAVCVYIAVNVIMIVSYADTDETKKCDTAIVLGAAADDNGVSPVYRERLNHALRLYNEKYISKIIVTGGYGVGNENSDACMAMKYLADNGIPNADILLEERSVITQENLEYSVEIMRENALDTVLIVSDPLHMKRAMLLAEDLGMECYSSPTESSAYKSIKTKLPFVLRETFFYIGYKWYRIFN